MDPSYQGAGCMDPETVASERIRIQREIEKEKIREEIIMSEIVRRRVLEAEVRRELMMEREMARRQGNDWFPFGSSPVMGLESPLRPSLLVTKAQGWSAEERLGMTLEDKEKLKRTENGGLETLPFQRGTADMRISEVKPATEGHKEKERILLLTKPNENASGSKTKDVTPPEVVNIELLAYDVIANKISKEEWSCALCQVMATSEKDLNEHVLGKEHESKVAALRAQGTGKNYSIGLFPMKATKPIHMKKKGVKLKAQSLFSQKARKATSKKDDLPLSENSKSKHLKKTKAEVTLKVQKNEDDPRKKVEKNERVINAHKLGNIERPADVIEKKKWSCALCQVSATSKYDRDKHVLGNKHKSKMAALKAQRTGKNHIIPKKVAKSIHVGEEGVKLKAQSLFSEKVGEATSKKDDLPYLGNTKSEHLKRTQAEGNESCQVNSRRRRRVKLKARSLFSEKVGEATSKKDDSPSLGNTKSEHLKRTQAEGNESCQVNSRRRRRVKLKAQSLFSEKVGEATSKKDDLSSLGNTKSEQLKRTQAEGNESCQVNSRRRRRVKLKAQSLFSDKVGEATSKKDDLPSLGNIKSEVIRKVQKNEDDPRKKVEKNESDPRKKGCKFSEVVNAHKFRNIELPADTANKKSEWRCALCQVCASSQKGLNDHVLGKKHKSKEAALRSLEE